VTHERPQTIDAYLATLDRARRPPLEKLRRMIRRAVPDAQECISYGMPAFRVDGGVVAGFAVTKDGFSYYPFSGQTLAALTSELAGHEGTKSALHFSTAQPLSAALVHKLVATRLAEIRHKHAPARGTAKPRPKRAAPRRLVLTGGRTRSAG
jgi:uncharacterized protein YdhG (YjbR/CyaY superfamily)